MKRAPRKPLPSVEFLAECFDYDRLTGACVWKVRPRSHFPDTRSWRTFNSRFAGKRAGRVAASGYIVVHLSPYGSTLLHRIVYKMATGYNPVLVDHVNRLKEDNRLENLRSANHTLNRRNMVRAGRTGIMGVHEARGGKWRSAIKVEDRQMNLGTFLSPQAAAEAYAAAKERYHGEFAPLELKGHDTV